jgi:IS5 family transposase
MENVGSDRIIISTASMRLDILYFIGYDIDERLPWHSTLSRTRQLYGEEIFLQLFQQVLLLCIQQGMVRGKRQAIDSAFIKANASLDSLMEKEIIDDAASYIDSLEEESDDEPKKESDEKNENQTVKASTKKHVDGHHAWKEKEYKDQTRNDNITGHTNKINNRDEHGDIIRPKLLSNHTHYSPTDPDSRISVKPGKPRQLNYLGQVSVDDAHHVITGTKAEHADKRDSQCLEGILHQTINNLSQNELAIKELVADGSYSSGSALAFIEQNNITAYIPNFGQYRSSREGFIYN